MNKEQFFSDTKYVLKNTGSAAAAFAVGAVLTFGVGHKHEQTPQMPIVGTAYASQIPNPGEPSYLLNPPQETSLQEDQAVTIQSPQNTPIELSITIPPTQDKTQTQQQMPVDGDERVVASRYIQEFNPNLRLPDRPYDAFWARFVYDHFKSNGLGDIAMTAVLESQCESGLDPTASYVNKDGSIDRGLLMINSVHGLGERAFDPNVNLAKGEELVRTNNGFQRDWQGCTTKVQTYIAGR